MTYTKGTILVTGANGGLGSATVKRIATSTELASYHGLYVVRSTSSALTSTLASAEADHTHEILTLDLTSQSSVRRAAATINARVATGEIPPIRALVLNAGFQDFGKQQWLKEADGALDVTFAANYLGHWLLTLLLLQSMDTDKGRIVIVCSQAHDPLDKRNERTKAFVGQYETIIHDQSSIDAIAKGTWSASSEEPGFRSGYRRYGASKLFLVMMIHSLQTRLDRDPSLSKICILGVDPGTMSTGLQRHAIWFIRVLLFKVIYPFIAWLQPNGPIRTTKRSAEDIVRAAFDHGPGLGEEPKGVYLDGAVLRETGEESRDAQKRDWVWKESVRLTGLKDDEVALVDWQ
ncbi:hypothetical protein N0V93_010144 [Gnomoniopsis smithogilvyi]|uniref:3beta-hydroxysteroid 3-dehydrogenase n=1 Tax=Gnomoniopsis smithogilvyi TaxID=1191159 RepID=A0A9W8YLS5_9PEZI|nr:hypothetical protein N0V93_010144 [Gnomoniopsis smithogilvyi]